MIKSASEIADYVLRKVAESIVTHGPNTTDAEAEARVRAALSTKGKPERKWRKPDKDIFLAGKSKLAFSVTDAGHQADAAQAGSAKDYFLDRARQMQENGGRRTLDPTTGESSGEHSLLSLNRFGGQGDPVVEARHQDYIQKQHAAGNNAWNPWGGQLTPLAEEQTKRPFSWWDEYGKVAPKQ